MGSDATALQESPESMSSGAAKKTMPERGTVSAPMKTAATVSPNESEIAAVAYQLWLDEGCPVGSDEENWFRAEAILKNSFVAGSEDLLRDSSASQPEFRTCELRWEGHWEVWESEWGGARWIWD
jgi:hypothetical protein